MSTAAINNSYLLRNGYQGTISNQVRNVLANYSSGGAAPAGAVNTASACSDGSDDGKIGLFDKLKSAVVGTVKSVWNGVKSIVTNPGKLLLTIGTIAACVAFPPLGVGLAAVGCVTGAAGIVKGGIAAANATTDAEAKAAWENIGSSTFQTVMSAVGVKAGLNAMKGTAGSAMKELSDKALKTGKSATLKDTASAAWKDIKSLGRGADKTARTTTIGGKTVDTGYKIAKIKDVWTDSGRSLPKTAQTLFEKTKIGNTYSNRASGTKTYKNGKETLGSKVKGLYESAKEVYKQNRTAKIAAKNARVQQAIKDQMDDLQAQIEGTGKYQDKGLTGAAKDAAMETKAKLQAQLNQHQVGAVNGQADTLYQQLDDLNQQIKNVADDTGLSAAEKTAKTESLTAQKAQLEGDIKGLTGDKAFEIRRLEKEISELPDGTARTDLQNQLNTKIKDYTTDTVDTSAKVTDLKTRTDAAKTAVDDAQKGISNIDEIKAAHEAYKSNNSAENYTRLNEAVKKVNGNRGLTPGASVDELLEEAGTYTSEAARNTAQTQLQTAQSVFEKAKLASDSAQRYVLSSEAYTNAQAGALEASKLTAQMEGIQSQLDKLGKIDASKITSAQRAEIVKLTNDLNAATYQLHNIHPNIVPTEGTGSTWAYQKALTGKTGTISSLNAGYTQLAGSLGRFGALAATSNTILDPANSDDKMAALHAAYPLTNGSSSPFIYNPYLGLA